jgi:hypothetical protein
MQYGLIYACEVSCTGEYLSPSGEGVQSTNNNENRCGYCAVLSVRQDRFWWQAAVRIHRHVHYEWTCVMNMPFPEKTDILSWPTGLHKNWCRLGVRRNSQVITKVIVWDIHLCVCHISCQSWRAVHCYSTFVNHMTHKASVASLM